MPRVITSVSNFKALRSSALRSSTIVVPLLLLVEEFLSVSDTVMFASGDNTDMPEVSSVSGSTGELNVRVRVPMFRSRL